MQALQNEITEKRLKSWVGKTTEVLIDGPSHADGTKMQGRNSQNILINLTESYPDLEPGMLINVDVSRASRYTLLGDKI